MTPIKSSGPNGPLATPCSRKQIEKPVKVFDLRMKNIINVNDLVRSKRVRNLQNLDISNNLKLGHPFDLSGFKDLDKVGVKTVQSIQFSVTLI